MMEDLLIKIGLDNNDLLYYRNFKELIGDKFNKYAEDFCIEGFEFNECLTTAKECIHENINEFTLDLMFIFECLPFVEKIYKQKNYPESVFIDSMKDIKYKINECREIYGVFGTFVAEWFVGFFKPYRFALGRLQFNDWVYNGKEMELNSFSLKKGDFITLCHIPSSGKLYYDDCLDSYKRAYAFFNHKLKDGILPIFIDSWLLYPPYKDVFDKNSNIYAFVKDYSVFEVVEHENFYDGWRVFGKNYDKNDMDLKTETSLQRKFIEYIKNKGTFGCAKGLLLFDGEKIIKTSVCEKF